jgi:histidyl-tRNA synthetase
VAVLLIGDTYAGAQDVIANLRLSGFNVAVDATDRKMDKKIKNADKAGCQHVLFIGETELANNNFALKNLSTGQEEHGTIEQITNLLNNIK